MKMPISIKNAVIDVICYLFTMLFVYAAVSKLLDFENFQVQLGQSPLLSAFARWVSWLVPIAELVTVVLIMVPKFRSAGLIAALSLMTMFTAYIFIILNYSSFVPCSCGGILEKMSWKTHLIFNLVFVIFALLAIIYQSQLQDQKGSLNPVLSVPISIFFSVSIIVILFLCSEEIMHYKNPFLRRYNRRVVLLEASKDLQVNSYYFSGYSNGKLYLGNYSTPLQIVAIDSLFKHSKTYKIDFKDRTVPFRSIRNIVEGKYFYLTDGTVPCLYYGSIDNWKIKGSLKNVPSFTSVQPIDTASFVFRNNAGKGSANILGIYNQQNHPKVRYAPVLLQKQFNGIFDTDGMLHYDQASGEITYIYYYRNEFFTADKNAVLVKRGHTIDTISRAKIKVALLREGTRQKMAAPPLLVNSRSAVKNNLLFVESKIQGLYENEAMWKYAAVIDVYDLKKNAYLLSFPVFGDKDEKLRSFFVTPTHFYAIIGTRLLMYGLRGTLKEEMKKTL